MIVFLSFFFWTLYCQSFLDLRLLVTPLVFSNVLIINYVGKQMTLRRSPAQNFRHTGGSKLHRTTICTRHHCILISINRLSMPKICNISRQTCNMRMEMENYFSLRQMFSVISVTHIKIRSKLTTFSMATRSSH